MSRKRWMFKYISALVFSLPALFVILVFPLTADAQAGAVEGKKVYEKYCIGCHGEKGDGRGIVAGDLIIKPRDFTSGMFKFKSTPTGTLPTNNDLKKVITRGLKTSAMPNFRLVPDADKEKLIAYVKSFSDRWEKERPGKKYAEAVMPDFVGTTVSIKRGKDLFAVRCQMCHGTKEGVPDVTFFLKWNEKECNDMVRPADFNYGVIKRGSRVEDIYSSITAGVEGTPMLSFADKLSEKDRWDLTSYILEIMGKERR